MSDRYLRQPQKLLTRIILSLFLMFITIACNSSVRVSAEERMFLDLSLEFLGEYQLPKQDYANTRVGGLSDLTYEKPSDRFYIISDDRSQQAPARFYTLKLDISPSGIEGATIEGVTFLSNELGETYPPQSSDTEGIALSPRNTLFISSEGVIEQEIAPFIKEYDLKSGQAILQVPVPQRYLPPDEEQPPRGIQNNLGFEALSISAPSLLKDEPFRLFTATEAALAQDIADSPLNNRGVRFLHYVVNPFGEPVLVAEHPYLLDPPQEDTFANGLTSLIPLEKEGYFLTLERTLGLSGYGAKIFEVINAGATDTSGMSSLKNMSGVKPLQKKLLLDLNQLNIELDNLEGMTFGPRFADGTQSLILISDDNFKPSQINQFLLFRLRKAT